MDKRISAFIAASTVFCFLSSPVFPGNDAPAAKPGTSGAAEEENPFKRFVKNIKKFEEDKSKEKDKKKKANIDEKIDKEEERMEKKRDVLIKPLEEKKEKKQKEIDVLKEKTPDADVSKLEAEIAVIDKEVSRIDDLYKAANEGDVAAAKKDDKKDDKKK